MSLALQITTKASTLPSLTKVIQSTNKRSAEADRKAREIKGSSAYSCHAAEERIKDNLTVDNSGFDEEDIIERRRLSETSCRKLELIACYESAKLPVYMPKKKVEAQPLIRSLRSALQELNGS